MIPQLYNSLTSTASQNSWKGSVELWKPNSQTRLQTENYFMVTPIDWMVMDPDYMSDSKGVLRWKHYKNGFLLRKSIIKKKSEFLKTITKEKFLSGKTWKYNLKFFCLKKQKKLFICMAFIWCSLIYLRSIWANLCKEISWNVMSYSLWKKKNTFLFHNVN